MKNTLKSSTLLTQVTGWQNMQTHLNSTTLPNIINTVTFKVALSTADLEEF